MKKTVKILALLCALMMLVSLVACGDKKDDTAKKSDEKTSDSSQEEATESNLTDFEWVKFEMPEGWADAAESPAYVTVKEDANHDHIVKLFSKGKGADFSVEDIAKDDAANDPERYTADAAVEIGGRTYYPVRFKFNDEDSVRLFTEVDSEHYCYITIFQMKEDAPAVQTILNSIEFDAEKF